jgi:TetR/AcrR family transcriptional repressor of lmrAB and yxaGH operons
MTLVIVKSSGEMMAGTTKQRMVEGAALLLAKHGLQATSFNDVLELTGAPRGSVYHHFPAGKDQLVASAVELAGERALSALDSAGDSPVAITEYFLALWRSVLERSNFSAGCAVLAVTIATDSPELLDHAADVFRAWRLKLASLFVAVGVEAGAASRFAALLVASSEGAVVLSRAEHDMEPFELVAEAMVGQAKLLAQ